MTTSFSLWKAADRSAHFLKLRPNDIMRTTSNSVLAVWAALALLALAQASALAQAEQGSEPQPPPTAPAPDQKPFSFPGGKPADLLHALDKFYNVNWFSVATIPDQMAETAVIPAFRISQDSVEPILRHQLGQANAAGKAAQDRSFSWDESDKAKALRAVVVLYNKLSQARPELGELVVEGDFAHPSVVMFSPARIGENVDIRIRAFALKGIPEKDWNRLQDEIVTASRHNPRFQGKVNIHPGTSLLVAEGPAAFLDMVDSFINAFSANHIAEALKEK